MRLIIGTSYLKGLAKKERNEVQGLIMERRGTRRPEPKDRNSQAESPVCPCPPECNALDVAVQPAEFLLI
eukprot:1140320-Pelagomonas_calceolata.AAC.4